MAKNMLQLITIFFLSFMALSLNSTEINKSYFGNLALNGYDAVAYFKEGKPVKGNESFQFIWNQATWRFSTEENLNQFKSNPDKYAPQYGGYCAYAMSEGKKYDVSPDSWSIINGKLYLNYDKEIHAKWEERKFEYIRQADSNWNKNGK